MLVMCINSYQEHIKVIACWFKVDLSEKYDQLDEKRENGVRE